MSASRSRFRLESAREALSLIRWSIANLRSSPWKLALLTALDCQPVYLTGNVILHSQNIDENRERLHL